MTMQRASTPLAWTACVFLLATAGLHLSVTHLVSTRVVGEMKPLFETLWIFFGDAFIVAALLVAVVAPVATPRRGLIMGIVALLPISGAVLMAVQLGFLPQLVLLGIDGLLLLASAATGRPATAH